jgi:hypothetical protein
MDGTILNGPTMAVVGITTVFIALTIIVTIVTIIARMLAPKDNASMLAPGLAVNIDLTDDAADDDDLLQKIALATYGFHLSRRVAVRTHVAPTAWLRAGRQVQVNRIRSRG